MNRILFTPFGIVAGVVAGIVGRKLFERIWRAFDSEADKPPEPGRRGEPLVRLVPALILEGAASRAARGVADRGAREAWRRFTGSWPGEKTA